MSGEILYRIDHAAAERLDLSTTGGLPDPLMTLIEDDVLVEVGSVSSDRLNAWHTVYLTDLAWHMAHPLVCDLNACEFAMVAIQWFAPPDNPGTYTWGPEITDWNKQ